MIRRYASIIADLATQLEARSALQLVNLPGAGRSLVAAHDIPQGTVIHAEIPMLATPAASALDSTCSACLRPLPAGGSGSGATARFCSSECKTEARGTWLQVHERCGFDNLHAACAQSGEKFPLLAARLACETLQRQDDANKESSTNCQNKLSTEQDVMRGDPLRDLGSLCFANVPQPPPEWVRMHALLQEGLDAGGVAPTAVAALDIQWYCWVLSRLHLNVFRVDTVPPLDLAGDPAALLRAAAAAVAGGGAPSSPQGSAVYLLASMFNHSCEPNVDVTFPENNSLLALVAATDVPRHTELTISYIDATEGRSARREKLRFAYGFDCQCPRCVEEEEG